MAEIVRMPKMSDTMTEGVIAKWHKKVVDKPTPSVKPASTPQPVVKKMTGTTATGDSRLKASPLAKKLSSEKGIDLETIHGTGENGRIVKRDIDWYKPGSAVKTSSGKSS